MIYGIPYVVRYRRIQVKKSSTILFQSSQTEERTSYAAFKAGRVKNSNHILITNLRLAQIKFPAKVYEVLNRDRSPRIFSNHPVDSIICRLCLSVKNKFCREINAVC
jgi:hypothetical protein